MKNNKSAITRALSFLLSLLIILSSVSISVFADEPRLAVVTESSVNVRTGPSTGYSTIGFKLIAGAYVDVLSEHPDEKGESIPWYKVSFVKDGTSYQGYIRSDLLRIVPPADENFEEQLEGFPEDYKPALRLLHQLHPNWNFVPYDAELDWSYVQSRENRNGYSYINDGIKTHYSTAEGCYNPSTGTYIVKEGTNWYQAHPDTVAHFMDPRNFLTENDIFQYELLAFSPATQTEANIAKMMEGTFMEGKYTTNAAGTRISYARAFYEVAVEANVSPFHLISRCIQEVGWDGNGCSLGTYSGYVGYYNFFNIGAHDGATSGMRYAKEQGWNTAYKAILGGAKLIGEKYIAVGQNTPYFQKFNVINKNNVGSHQYMTNIAAARDEGRIQRRKYNSLGMMETAFTFTIPIYDNMPLVACMQPPASGSLNNYLGGLWVEGYELTPEFAFQDTFENGRTSYSVSVPKDIFSLNVVAAPASTLATVSGNGEYFLEDINGSITVTCTNDKGSKRKYTIKVNLLEPEDPPDLPSMDSVSGTTGECTWILEGTVLAIYGTGPMGFYTADSPAPWGTAITAVAIESGVTSIGDRAFAGCTELTDLKLSATVTEVGPAAFASCSSLATVSYEGILTDREKISIGSDNEPLMNATWKYDVCMGNSETQTHVYDNTCDEICNACGIKRTISHAYANACDTTCDVCGAERTAGAHVYDNTCDAACNVCGATRNPEHAYSNACDTTCNLCGGVRTTKHYTKVKVDTTAHTKTNDSTYPFTQSGEWTVSTNKTKSTTSVYTITARHDCELKLDYKVSSEKNYDKLYVKKGSAELDVISGEAEKSMTVSLSKGETLTVSYSKDGRTDGGSDCGSFKIACTCTGEKEVLSDTLSPTCSQAVVCTRCNAVVKNVAPHSYDDACDTACNVCGATRTPEHSYDNACDKTCNLCGAVRTTQHYTKVTVPATSHTAVNDSTYPFTRSGEWTVSTNKTKSTTSVYTITAQHDCKLKLDYKVSSEAEYDKLYVKKGSAELDVISGEAEKSMTISLSKGETLTVSYSKDGRTDGGSDCGSFKITCSCTTEEEVLSDSLSPTCSQAVVCTRCNTVVKNTIPHSYDNDCDTACNVCGATRTPAHKYGEADGICTVCGAERPPYVPGDLDGEEGITINDAIYLLFHVNFPEVYPVDQPVDFDGNGTKDMSDAIHLLFHVNFPEVYPLS